MSKFNQLLNENTIVDFGLLWRLARRYRSHFIVAMVFFIITLSYNYFSQPIIYAINVPMKAISQHTVANDLSALLPVENTNSVNLSELKISMENHAFLKSLATMAITDRRFDLYDFGSITSNKSVYGVEFKKQCGKDVSCLTEKVANSIKGLFNVEQGLTENRFVLTVNAIDKPTVKALTGFMMKAIEQNRINVRQYQVLKEISGVGSLIAESRSIIQKMDGYTALEEQEKLQNNISDLKERIRALQNSSSAELANVTALESRLNQNKKSTRYKNDPSMAEVERIKKHQTRLVEIKQNISLLTNIPEANRSPADSLIITQLKNEHSLLSQLLPPEPKRRSIELTDSFSESQRVKTGDFEFDYQVAKNKLLKLNQDYETSKEELNKMFQQKIINENKVISMKADLEFLKNLESKQMSLKLLNATMTSDLFFEDTGTYAKEFRQSSSFKVFLFSFSITAFFHLLSIVFRFFMDDRIYSEEDLKVRFNNLDFIGEVPTFGT